MSKYKEGVPTSEVPELVLVYELEGAIVPGEALALSGSGLNATK